MQEGDSSDPFAEADRREREQRKAGKAGSHAALTFHAAAQPQATAAPTSALQLTYGSAPASSAPATGQILNQVYSYFSLLCRTFIRCRLNLVLPALLRWAEEVIMLADTLSACHLSTCAMLDTCQLASLLACTSARFATIVCGTHKSCGGPGKSVWQLAGVLTACCPAFL